jgi:hypothetical protein
MWSISRRNEPSVTRQRLWMLAGKGPFQFTGVLVDIEQAFNGLQ